MDWYPRVLSLHRFMVAMARAALNQSHGSCGTVDPLVWDRGSRPRVSSKVDRVVREYACMPSPAGCFGSRWFSVDSGLSRSHCWSSSRPFFLPFNGQKG